MLMENPYSSEMCLVVFGSVIAQSWGWQDTVICRANLQVRSNSSQPVELLDARISCRYFFRAVAKRSGDACKQRQE